MGHKLKYISPSVLSTCIFSEKQTEVGKVPHAIGSNTDSKKNKDVKVTVAKEQETQVHAKQEEAEQHQQHQEEDGGPPLKERCVLNE